MALAWQASLFGSAPPLPDAGFATLTRRELDGGAWVDHAPGWLDGHDEVFAALVANSAWAQRRRRMYDDVVDEPRLTSWWRLRESTDGLPPAVLGARDLLAGRYGVDFDSVGCNLYRDGSDSVAWHGDTVRRKMAEPVVAILSLGEPRRLLLRPVGGGRSLAWGLGRGDLLVMGGTCQHTWQHCIPKVRHAGPRMSVTYRHSRPGPAG